MQASETATHWQTALAGPLGGSRATRGVHPHAPGSYRHGRLAYRAHERAAVDDAAGVMSPAACSWPTPAARPRRWGALLPGRRLGRGGAGTLQGTLRRLLWRGGRTHCRHYRRIIEDEELPSAGTAWRAVIGRGHSPEHLCLHCPELKLLISGDQVLPRITSNVSVFPTEPDADPLTEWLESLRGYTNGPG